MKNTKKDMIMPMMNLWQTLINYKYYSKKVGYKSQLVYLIVLQELSD